MPMSQRDLELIDENLGDDEGMCEICGKVITINEAKNLEVAGIPEGQMVVCFECFEKEGGEYQ